MDQQIASLQTGWVGQSRSLILSLLELVLGQFERNPCEPTTCVSSRKGQDVLLFYIYVQLLI